VKKRLPHFMMLTILSMIVSSPALFPPAALCESNGDEQAVENTYQSSAKSLGIDAGDGQLRLREYSMPSGHLKKLILQKLTIEAMPRGMR
jgi:hypothetical protein